MRQRQTAVLAPVVAVQESEFPPPGTPDLHSAARYHAVFIAVKKQCMLGDRFHSFPPSSHFGFISSVF